MAIDATTSRVRVLCGELLAECMATFIILAIGDSAAAMYTLYDPSPYQHAYWGVCIAWGLSVTLAIYVAAPVSGAHANPAVTLAQLLYRGFPRAKVLPYVGAQIVGAFLGAAIVYLLFAPVINQYNELHHLSRHLDGGAAGVFFTHPGAGISSMHAFVDEIVLTGILVLGIFAITEEFNTVAPTAGSGALMIGLLVATIGASAGYLEAWPINPARDLGPRIFCFFSGWGHRRSRHRRASGGYRLPDPCSAASAAAASISSSFGRFFPRVRVP
jgi:glycerol uptake facilitator protein